MDADAVHKLKATELKDKLKELGLKYSGKKADLAQRLLEVCLS